MALSKAELVLLTALLSRASEAGQVAAYERENGGWFPRKIGATMVTQMNEEQPQVEIYLMGYRGRSWSPDD